MLFFRSEDALQEWLASHHAERGAVLSVQQLWDLSQPWYENRMSPEFHGRTAEQAQEVFREAGLTSAFWHAD
jgi:hypothetical protein